MRTKLAKAVLVIGVGLVAYLAMRVAGSFVNSFWTPGAISALVMGTWVLAVRWWYRDGPQSVDPARDRRLLLSGMAISVAVGAAGIVAAVAMMP